MQYNRKISISMAGSRKAVFWPENETTWLEFTGRLAVPVRSPETLEEYLVYPKARQDELKDAGGFVGGTFFNGRRRANEVKGRDLVTLDLDNIPPGQTHDILKRIKGLGCASAVYSTRKHAGYAPRLRVVIPLDRTALADEYEPAARKLASIIGISLCDPTTFEASRLMYWPSCCSDGEYIYETNDAPFCSLDGILAMYGNWQDISQWPQVPGSEAAEKKMLAKQADPLQKRGIIGAFCRTYGITEAMDKFLPGIYEETSVNGRYTYTGGSTTGGAVVYDGDKFLYSHHATDPCSGLLVNAFDMVRLHKFGDEDAEAKEGTPAAKLPSFIHMSQLAVEDKAVSGLVAQERHTKAVEAFASTGKAECNSTDSLEWMEKLSLDRSGNIEKTINNMVLVLENDPLLKGKVATDEFAGRGVAAGKLPWNTEENIRWWTDADDASFYRYMETFYRLTGKDKLDNALLIASSQNRINEVRNYLKSLKWDGIKRVDTLLPDYLGAEDSGYTHAVMRKSLCAAVARAVTGGIKYDTMPIFIGPQGIGKSSFLAVLGGKWFSDSLASFSGKDAAEMIQGTWINEIGELTAMTKSEQEVVKQFLSKCDDIYRVPYGKRTDKFPRRCVFFGTSNKQEILRDITGNRRFWPVDVGIYKAKKCPRIDLPKERDQVWAEAYVYWMLGEKIYFNEAQEKAAEIHREAHMETSGKEGLIKEFLEQPVPEGWNSMDKTKRMMFLSGGMKPADGTNLVLRDRVCAMEIWTECFRCTSIIKRADSLEIMDVLSKMDGWKRASSTIRCGPYGIQKGFLRK